MSRMIDTLLILLLGLLGFALSPLVYAQNSALARSAIYSTIFTSAYDPNTRPGFDNGDPVTVEVQYRINLLYGVSTRDEIFSLDLYVRETWIDPRLIYNASMWPSTLGSMRIPSNKIWKPDTFFYNAVSCSSQGEELVTLDYTGRVRWSRHLTCTFHVSFDLIEFPFDHQLLYLRRISFGYNINELLLIQNQQSCFLPDPQVDWQNELWDITYTQCENNVFKFRDGQPYYTQVVTRLGVERKAQNYIVKLILPMFVIVLLSTMTYWVDPLSAPARVGGSVTLVLSIVTFNLVVSNDLPKINYSTLLDWYVWKCFLFVIFSVGEFSFVNHLLTAKNSAGQPRFNSALGYGVDDWCQWTVGILWILSNLLYWPFITNLGARIFIGLLEFGYAALNVYRCWWNFKNGHRGLVLYGIWYRKLKKYINKVVFNKVDEKEAIDSAVQLAATTGK